MHDTHLGDMESVGVDAGLSVCTELRVLGSIELVNSNQLVPHSFTYPSSDPVTICWFRRCVMQ